MSFPKNVVTRNRPILVEHLLVVALIDDKPISIVKSFSHLGHLINSDLSDDDDFVKRRNDFFGQLNNICVILKSCTLMYSIGCFSINCQPGRAKTF